VVRAPDVSFDLMFAEDVNQESAEQI